MNEKSAQKENDFQNIHEKYFEKILNYAKFRVKDLETAEELAQDVFLSLWQFVRENGSESIKNKKKFLYTVARNKIIDHYRSRKSEASLDDVGEHHLAAAPRQEKKVDNDLNMAYVKKALRGLDKKYKNMIVFRYFKQMSIEEICRATGKSPNHVSVLIHKGVKLLGKKIRRFESI
jgi:RNA polymerase sigma-70 factor (ECF subfamily)